mmetsp:Transcript_66282/g.153927  ORF Transcript_66282/g.153927 Transcript_66282/m.153927 type:complete len:554 (-) Transcript_66282:65-1726(-)
MRALLEQAMQKQKLEKIIESILALEAQLDPAASTPSVEEVQRRAAEAVRATEMLAERNVLAAMAYLMPAAMQGRRVYDAFEKRRQAAQERVAKLAYEEMVHLCNDVQSVVNIEEGVRVGIFETLSNMEMPSLATLLASAFAPAQLRILLVINTLSLLIMASFVLCSCLVLMVDQKLTCGRIDARKLHLWFTVDLIVSGFCLVIRLWVVRTIGRMLAHMDEPPRTMDEPVKAFRALLDYYLTTGADALASLDETAKSFLYTLANWAVVFGCGWMFFATSIVFNTPWVQCHTAGLIILRVRVVLFLILFVPIILNLALFFVARYLESDNFRVAMIGAADSTDQALGVGLPVISILVQSLLVRNRHDMVRLQLRRHELRKLELQLEQREAERKLEGVAKSQQDVEELIQKFGKKRDAEVSLSDDELREKHIAAKNAILSDAELVFQRLSQSAESFSKQAEAHVRSWEQTGGPGILQAVRDGSTLAQVREYAEQTAQLAESGVRELVSNEQVRAVAEGARLAVDLAHARVQEGARSAVDAARARVQEQDLGSPKDVS